MNKIESYLHIIQSLLTNYAAIPIANGLIDCYTIFYTKQDHYQVINVGWRSAGIWLCFTSGHQEGKDLD
jgi:hypothetical protein